MKPVVITLFLIQAILTNASPSLPVHPGGVGGLFKGPNSETIIKGPDGSVITAAVEGGEVHTKLDPIVVAEPEPIIVEPSPILIAPAPVAAVAPVAVVPVAAPVNTVELSAPVVEPQEPSSDLVGPSGAISTRGSNSIVAGPASTTITGQTPLGKATVEGPPIISTSHESVGTLTVAAVEPIAPIHSYGESIAAPTVLVDSTPIVSNSPSAYQNDVVTISSTISPPIVASTSAPPVISSTFTPHNLGPVISTTLAPQTIGSIVSSTADYQSHGQIISSNLGHQNLQYISSPVSSPQPLGVTVSSTPAPPSLLSDASPVPSTLQIVSSTLSPPPVLLHSAPEASAAAVATPHQSVASASSSSNALASATAGPNLAIASVTSVDQIGAIPSSTPIPPTYISTPLPPLVSSTPIHSTLPTAVSSTIPPQIYPTQHEVSSTLQPIYIGGGRGIAINGQIDVADTNRINLGRSPILNPSIQGTNIIASEAIRSSIPNTTPLQTLHLPIQSTTLSPVLTSNLGNPVISTTLGSRNTDTSIPLSATINQQIQRGEAEASISPPLAIGQRIETIQRVPLTKPQQLALAQQQALLRNDINGPYEGSQNNGYNVQNSLYTVQGDGYNGQNGELSIQTGGYNVQSDGYNTQNLGQDGQTAGYTLQNEQNTGLNVQNLRQNAQTAGYTLQNEQNSGRNVQNGGYALEQNYGPVVGTAEQQGLLNAELAKGGINAAQIRFAPVSTGEVAETQPWGRYGRDNKERKY